jgi:ribosomal protein L11 methylase PrmA
MPAAADVITANLTGALLMRAAPALSRSVTAGHVLVLSGILRSERDAVVRAFGAAQVVWEAEEDGWAGLTVRVP